MTLAPERRRDWIEARYPGGEAEAMAREIADSLTIYEIGARLRDRPVPRPSETERRQAFVEQETERFREDPAAGVAELGALVLDRIANEAAFAAGVWERGGLTAADVRLCAAFWAEGMDEEPGAGAEAIALRWAARPHELGDWLAEEGNARGLDAAGLLAAIRGGKTFYGSTRDWNALYDRAKSLCSTGKEGSA